MRNSNAYNAQTKGISCIENMYSFIHWINLMKEYHVK